MLKQLIIFLIALTLVGASTKKKPHGHKGVLEPFDGKPIPFKVTRDQETKLAKGETVSHFFLFKSRYFSLLSHYYLIIISTD
jgi:hypothetical protein